jgi:hypothetical protein
VVDERDPKSFPTVKELYDEIARIGNDDKEALEDGRCQLASIAARISELSGHGGSRNPIQPDFYVACSTIFPVLVVAGFVEISSLRGPVIRAWRAIAFARRPAPAHRSFGDSGLSI